MVGKVFNEGGNFFKTFEEYMYTPLLPTLSCFMLAMFGYFKKPKIDTDRLVDTKMLKNQFYAKSINVMAV